MNILFLDSPAFAKEDMIDAFLHLGFHVDRFFHPDYHKRISDSYDRAFDQMTEDCNYDFVFSFNYFPILSTCCKRHNMIYVSYVYDSPLVNLYSCTITYSGNYIFLFDKTIYQEFVNGGITTVYYLPLAANPKRLMGTYCDKKMKEALACDISFVGSMYNEDHRLYDRMYQRLQPYTRGYLEAVIDVQKNLYGSFIMQEMLNGPILADMEQAEPYSRNPDGIESSAYIYAHYYLARKLAEVDRTQCLELLSRKHHVRLYTNKPTPQLTNVENKGSVDYYNQMPLVFRNSRINLNITLRSIQSGIPLRALDIMGCGGFLLSNYQADFFDYFTAGEDYAYYTSMDELVSLSDYYLNHENERCQIAANALGKIYDHHTWEHRIKYILNTIKRPD